MGVRTTLASLLSAPAARLLERDLRDLVEDVLASRPLATVADVEALREDLTSRPPAASDAEARIAALEAEVESLKKKLGMAMGAVQAGTAQLMQVRQLAEEARAAAGQASQLATSARATAESAVDGLAALEDRVAMHGTEAPLVVSDAPNPADAAPAPSEGADRCKVPGCGGALRARGFCGRHYQQFRRNTLDGFVGPDGIVPIDGRIWRVDPAFAGSPATWDEGRVQIAGAPVAAEPVSGD